MTPNQILDAANKASQLIGDPKVQAGIKVARDVYTTVKSGSSGKESSGGSSSSSSGSGVGYLSGAANPAETRLNTGIPLTLLEKNYTKAEENVCSPMHTSHVLFALPVAATSQINDWYTRISTRDYQTRVQEEVNWAVDIATKFSASNITLAMNGLYKSLQIYFFYRSIDSYNNVGPNQNDAMYAIRSEWDFDTNYKLSQIARLLSRTPLPPNMLAFCRYIQSNFYSGETPNSPIIKIVPFPRSSQAKLTTNATLDDVITTLTNTTYIDVWNTIGRICKSWIPGMPSNIYDPPLIPTFDRDFITIFNNLPSANGIATKLYSPNVATVNTAFTYLSWNNQLDGMAVALVDAWNTTTNDWCIGTVRTQADAGHTRFSYYNVAGVYGWYQSRTYPFLGLGRQDTYTSNGTVESTSHRFGSDMVINVTPLMLTTTAINAVDWLLSSSDIKGTNVQRNFVPNANGNKRRRKSK